MEVSPQSLILLVQAGKNLTATMLRGVSEDNAEAVPTSSIDMKCLLLQGLCCKSRAGFEARTKWQAR